MEAIARRCRRQMGWRVSIGTYLDVTRQVNSQLSQGFFADPAFMTQLDVAFAKLYFAAVGAAGTPAAAPLAWRRERPHQPRPADRDGQHLHSPGDRARAGPHFADYQKVDQLLDAAEQSVRQSLESAAELAVDRRLAAVASLVTSWTITSGRDLAWNNALLLWAVRDDPIARGLFPGTLATFTALASKMLLVAV